MNSFCMYLFSSFYSHDLRFGLLIELVSSCIFLL
jgi:hypothetical protein